MLFLKRLFTTIAFTVFLSLVFSFGGLIIGAAAVGGATAAKEHATDYESGQRIGREVGAAFGQKYGRPIFIGATGLAFLISAGLSFSGLFPWCRRPAPPPPLPYQPPSF